MDGTFACFLEKWENIEDRSLESVVGILQTLTGAVAVAGKLGQQDFLLIGNVLETCREMFADKVPGCKYLDDELYRFLRSFKKHYRGLHRYAQVLCEMASMSAGACRVATRYWNELDVDGMEEFCVKTKDAILEKIQEPYGQPMALWEFEVDFDTAMSMLGNLAAWIDKSTNPEKILDVLVWYKDKHCGTRTASNTKLPERWWGYPLVSRLYDLGKEVERLEPVATAQVAGLKWLKYKGFAKLHLLKGARIDNLYDHPVYTRLREIGDRELATFAIMNESKRSRNLHDRFVGGTSDVWRLVDLRIVPQNEMESFMLENVGRFTRAQVDELAAADDEVRYILCKDYTIVPRETKYRIMRTTKRTAVLVRVVTDDELRDWHQDINLIMPLIKQIDDFSVLPDSFWKLIWAPLARPLWVQQLLFAAIEDRHCLSFLMALSKSPIGRRNFQVQIVRDDLPKLLAIKQYLPSGFWKMIDPGSIDTIRAADLAKRNKWVKYGLSFFPHVSTKRDTHWNSKCAEVLCDIIENDRLDELPCDVDAGAIGMLENSRLFSKLLTKTMLKQPGRVLAALAAAHYCLAKQSYGTSHRAKFGHWTAASQKFKDGNPAILFREDVECDRRFLKSICTHSFDSGHMTIAHFYVYEMTRSFLERISLTRPDLHALRCQYFVSLWKYVHDVKDIETQRPWTIQEVADWQYGIIDAMTSNILYYGFEDWKRHKQSMPFPLYSPKGQTSIQTLLKMNNPEVFPFLASLTEPDRVKPAYLRGSILRPTLNPWVRDIDTSTIEQVRQEIPKGTNGCAPAIGRFLVNIEHEWENPKLTAAEVFQWISIPDQHEKGTEWCCELVNQMLAGCPNTFYKRMVLQMARSGSVMPFNCELLEEALGQMNVAVWKRDILGKILSQLFLRSDGETGNELYFFNDNPTLTDCTVEPLASQLFRILLADDTILSWRVLKNLAYFYPFLFFEDDVLSIDQVYDRLIEKLEDMDNREIAKKAAGVLVGLFLCPEFAEACMPRFIDGLTQPDQRKTAVEQRLLVINTLFQFPGIRYAIVGLMLRMGVLDKLDLISENSKGSRRLRMLGCLLQTIANGDKRACHLAIAISQMESPFTTVIRKPVDATSMINLENTHMPFPNPARQTVLALRLRKWQQRPPVSSTGWRMNSVLVPKFIQKNVPVASAGPVRKDGIFPSKWLEALSPNMQQSVIYNQIQRVILSNPAQHLYLLSQPPWVYHWILEPSDSLTAYHYVKLFEVLDSNGGLKAVSREDDDSIGRMVRHLCSKQFVASLCRAFCPTGSKLSEWLPRFVGYLRQLLILPGFKEALAEEWNNMPLFDTPGCYNQGMLVIATCIIKDCDLRKLSLLFAMAGLQSDTVLRDRVVTALEFRAKSCEGDDIYHIMRILTMTMTANFDAENSEDIITRCAYIIKSMNNRDVTVYLQHIIVGCAMRHQVSQLLATLRCLEMAFPDELSRIAEATLGHLSVMIKNGLDHDKQSYVNQIINIFGDRDTTKPTVTDIKGSGERLSVFWKFVQRSLDYIIGQNETDSFGFRFAFLKKVPLLLPYRTRIHLLYEACGQKMRRQLRISVRRSRVLEDSFSQLREDKIGFLHVKFDKEQGYDASGLTREWFTLLSKELFNNPNYALFKRTESGRSLEPNPASGVNHQHLAYFGFAGKVVGLALMHRVPIHCHFCRSMLKLMLGQDVDIEDLRDVDLALYKNLQWILEHSMQDGPEIYFTAAQPDLGSHREIPLKEGGASIKVTDENKSEFLDLMAKHKLVTVAKDQLDAFVAGFHKVISPSDLNFDTKELDLLICGQDEIDINNLQSTCRYEMEYHAHHPVIERFFRVIRSWKPEQLTDLLLFVTGSPCVPVGGFSQENNTNITICHGGPPNRLPTAHTCTRTLDLPAYDSDALMNEKLLYAIAQCRSFEFQ